MLFVEDELRGIAEDQLRQLTDPFFTTRRDSGGTGLGLSISLKIISDHQGTLGFKSDPGKGTTVTVTLPAIKKAGKTA